MFHHFGADDRSVDARCAHTRAGVAIAGDQQDSTQVEDFARLTAQALNGDRIAWFDAVLLPACFHNGVHRYSALRPEWLTAPYKKTPRAQAARLSQYTHSRSQSSSSGSSAGHSSGVGGASASSLGDS